MLHDLGSETAQRREEAFNDDSASAVCLALAFLSDDVERRKLFESLNAKGNFDIFQKFKWHFYRLKEKSK